MKSFLALSVCIFGIAATATAGQIMIGQYAGNAAGGATSGLTQAYVNGTGGVSCVGAIFQGNTCAAGSATGWTERNYSTSLFASATISTSNPNPSYQFYNGYSSSSDSAGNTATDGTNTFAMINDSSIAANANAWAGSALGSHTITVPVGLSDVGSLSLMLNNLYGPAGANNTDVIFNFATTSNATSNLTQVTVDLSNSGDTASPNAGQVRDATDCGASIASPTGYTSPGCQTLATQALATSGTLTSSISVNNGAPTAGSINYSTGNVYNSTYSGGQSSSSAYYNTSGTVNLDSQTFNLGAYAGMFLVSFSVVQVSEVAGGFTLPGAGSVTYLSAATVNVVPEPSTTVPLVLMACAGAFGYVRRRRRA